MSIHINKFIDRVRSLESRPQRELTISISEARDLMADITKLLLALQVLHEEKSAAQTVQTGGEIEVQGGNF